MNILNALLDSLPAKDTPVSQAACFKKIRGNGVRLLTLTRQLS